jgi:DNA-binding transcriptional ArsR family regulator
MLFRAAILEKIKTGEVKLAFRRWRKPTVKPGGRLRTAAGELAIEAVDPCEEADIPEADAVAAGFAGRDVLLAELRQRDEGTLYRITFHLAGPDSRIALRDADDLSPAGIDAIAARLAKLDRSGERPWTLAVLQFIADHDGTAAREIAAAFGVEKDVLKRNIRKLKELGLTESLEVGYRLSPRGRAVLGSLPHNPNIMT